MSPGRVGPFVRKSHERSLRVACHRGLFGGHHAPIPQSERGVTIYNIIWLFYTEGTRLTPAIKLLSSASSVEIRAAAIDSESSETIPFTASRQRIIVRTRRWQQLTNNFRVLFLRRVTGST